MMNVESFAMTPGNPTNFAFVAVVDEELRPEGLPLF